MVYVTTKLTNEINYIKDDDDFFKYLESDGIKDDTKKQEMLLTLKDKGKVETKRFSFQCKSLFD